MPKPTESLEIFLTKTEMKNYLTFRESTRPDDVDEDTYNRQLFLAGANWLAGQLETIIEAEMKKVEPSDEPSEETPEETPEETVSSEPTAEKDDNETV